MWGELIYRQGSEPTMILLLYLLLATGVRDSLGVLPASTMKLGPLDMISRLARLVLTSNKCACELWGQSRSLWSHLPSFQGHAFIAYEALRVLWWGRWSCLDVGLFNSDMCMLPW